MDSNKDSLLRLANASGFLFQLKVEREIRRLASHHDTNWIVVASEHRWIDPLQEAEKYIDIVCQSHAGRMVIECKRVRQGDWVFLVGDGKTNMLRSRLLWTYLAKEKGPFARWDEFKLSYATPESAFCVVRGQGESQQSMLERIAGPLLRSTEVLADQELEFGLDRPYGPAWIYIPAIVTNATLHMCRFNPEDIDLRSGELPDAEFEEVPMVRFRKALSTTMEGYVVDPTTGKVSLDQHRTVLVINSDNMAAIFSGVEVHEFGDAFPWVKHVT